MLLRRRRTEAIQNADDREVIVEHGTSLAKGPALIVGSILVAFGLASLLKNADFPSASANFPDGTAQGSNFLGFEVNGWTGFFCITAGALLLFGAAQHHLAKMMSLLVGLALGACAVIALIDGHDVLGLAAANGWTKLGWAVAAVVLVLNVLAPRRRRERVVRAGGAAAVAPAATRTDRGRVVADEPARRGRFGRHRDVEVVDEPATTVGERPPRA
ncbi:DUF4383 domain-containing protein [Baekduia soli]|uniref:DUF4383 domain-containing protein n=1 Tax=Baekduia soli TaxID=496014 RepID=A0A5B8UBY5_9ACTN|nr:DUF4383 domain-containing protein [Baekduia soli]QEC50152.1 DUF4383 domain-containing protein [Baekduia soli]